jgi:LysM repeat protein
MSGRRIAILVVLLLALCCVSGALGLLAYRLFVAAPPVIAVEEGPTILIDDPRHGDEVTVGEAVQVMATGKDPRKIARMELWVDGELITSQASALSGGTSPFPLVGLWVATTRGNHSIVVRGYNMDDVSGQASISVNAVDAPQIPEGCPGVTLFEHEVQAGESLEGIAAGYELTVDQVLACNPGLDPGAPLTPGESLHIPVVVSPDEEGPPPDWPPPADAETPADLPPDAEDLPGEELPPAEEEPPPGEEPPPEVEEPPEIPEGVEPPEPEAPPTVLGFEALEFEVDQAYDSVYCLAQLADLPMERIPEAAGSSLNLVAGNYWDIQAELAGINSRMVTVEGDTFRVEVECFGWVGINGWSLGHFVREHPEADWTGDEIEVQETGEDGHWLRVVYRICPSFPCEPRPVPDPPTNLHEFTFWGFPFVGWDWAGDEATIDGFRLYRDDVMVWEQHQPAWRAMLVQPSVMPCGDTYSYDVTAYEGFPGVGVESDPSNAVTRSGSPCSRTVVVTFESLHTGCIRGDPCMDLTCATCEVPNFRAVAVANAEWVVRDHIGTPPDITSQSVIPMSTIFPHPLWPWLDNVLTVDLDPGDDLTIAVVILDWDWPPHYGILLSGARTIDSGDVATGDYILTLQDPPGPYVASGSVVVHLDVNP